MPTKPNPDSVHEPKRAAGILPAEPSAPQTCRQDAGSTLVRSPGAFLMAAVAALALQSAVAHAASPRERLSLDADWRFQRNDPTNIAGKLSYDTVKAWLLPSSADFMKADQKPVRPAGDLEGGAYSQPAFNDSAWRKLNLPHDWGIEGPFIPAGQPGSDGATGRLPYWGIAWYRKHFALPASDAGRRISLEMDGAMSYSEVWCNDQFVGGWPYGYASFSLDLTPYVKAGAENVLAIRLENYPNSSRWYPGGGIYRNVWLTKTAPIHVAHWGTYVTTPEVSAPAATVKIDVTVVNDTGASAAVSVKNEICELDANGVLRKPIASITVTDLEIGAHKSAGSTSRIAFKNPRLWSLDKPQRYAVVTSVQQKGRLVDTYQTPFGIRALKFDPDKGFFLNGEHVKLNGVCDHHDLGALGSAVNTRALQRQLEILREMGCNAIRTSHNPPAPELLDLADQMGFVVMDETFDTWRGTKRPNDYGYIFREWHEQDTRMLVRRDRNHPSVILWSIGNEVGEQGQGEAGAAVARELAGIVHEENPTRPTTSAENSARAGSPFAAALDALGLNYQGSRLPRPQYPSFKESFPDRFIYGSETASTISSRGEYTFPVVPMTADTPYGIVSGGGGGRRGGAGGPPPGQDVANHQMSSYDLYFPGWATSPDMEFAAQDRFPYVGGEFVWTGFDYIGEPTPWGGGNDPSRSSYFGIIDLAGFKKDRFYIYQAHWRPDFPMAHILPHWNWPDRVGQVTPVHVYTSGDEAELFLNGKSLGRLKKEQYQYRLRWDDVQYEPGELKVVAYKNGKQWATDVMKTAGPAAKLMAQADHSTIKADRQDLSFVTVSIVDKAGVPVPRSKNHVSFEVSGPGEIVATDNGDATSFESFQSKERNAFNGLCLVIVRSTGKTGDIVLKATSPDLQSTQVTIKGKAK